MNEHFGKCLPPLSYLVSTLLREMQIYTLHSVEIA